MPPSRILCIDAAVAGRVTEIEREGEWERERSKRESYYWNNSSYEVISRINLMPNLYMYIFINIHECAFLYETKPILLRIALAFKSTKVSTCSESQMWNYMNFFFFPFPCSGNYVAPVCIYFFSFKRSHVTSLRSVRKTSSLTAWQQTGWSENDVTSLSRRLN